jgi:preprotein translocase subunit SecG
MFNARGTSSILTKATWTLATIFIVNCVIMATISSRSNKVTLIAKHEVQQQITGGRPGVGMARNYEEEDDDDGEVPTPSKQGTKTPPPVDAEKSQASAPPKAAEQAKAPAGTGEKPAPTRPTDNKQQGRPAARQDTKPNGQSNQAPQQQPPAAEQPKAATPAETGKRQ